MKIVTWCFLFIVFAFTGCDKSLVGKTLPVTDAVKTGNWMVLYFEGNISGDIGVTFIQFGSTGSLTGNKDGTPFTGSWAEENTNGNNTLTLNITTTDIKLQKVNRKWKVTGITEYFIDLKDNDASGNASLQLMKH